MNKNERRKKNREARVKEGERCNLFGLRFLGKHVLLEAMGVNPETNDVVQEELWVVRYYYSEYHKEIVARISLK